MRYSIYTLSHPATNLVFYVGKSVNVPSRYKTHLNLNESDKSIKAAIINYMLENGYMPIVEEIDHFECKYREDEDYVNELEIYWMHQLKSWGMPICNYRGLYTTQKNVRNFSHLLEESAFEYIKRYLDEKSDKLSEIKKGIEAATNLTAWEKSKLLAMNKRAWNNILGNLNKYFEIGFALVEYTSEEKELLLQESDPLGVRNTEDGI